VTNSRARREEPVAQGRRRHRDAHAAMAESR
jgi:hypothetical protein